MDGCKPMGTPLDPHAKLMKFFDDKYEKKLLQWTTLHTNQQ